MSRTASLALFAWLLLAACGSGNPDSADNSSGKAPEETTPEDEEETPPIPVEIAIPDRGDVYALFSGTAPIEAFAEANAIAKVAGEIREILVEEGDDVEREQVVAKLDGDRLALELNESRARLEKLKRDYQRNLNLRDRSLISEGDLEKLRYEMEAMEASYNLARLELDYTQIRSPIRGVISERFIRLGNTVEPGDALFRVTGLDPLVAYLYVPEREYRRVKPGQPVGIQIDALGDTPIFASVTRVSPVIDSETGTFKITIEISDETRRIKPGMFARIGVIYDQRNSVLRVPRSALLEEKGQSSVFVVEDNIAKRRIVTTGYSDRGMVEVMTGLGDGEKVVTVGQLGLKDGAEVSIINERGEVMPPEGAGVTPAAGTADDTPSEGDN